MLSLVAKNLIKEYGKAQVLKGINMSINEGEFYALMGPNGSGKTTLVSIIASVIPPTSGEVNVYGHDIMGEAEDARKLIGYLPESGFSSPSLSGEENLFYFAQLWGLSRGKAKNLTSELLERVGLAGEGRKKVSKYSSGMKRRLELATILFPGVKILILDEPVTGLDPSARKEFLGFLKEMNKEGATIFLITHIGEDAEVASRVGLMDEGRLIAEGKPDELKRNSGLSAVISVKLGLKNKEILATLGNLSKDGKVLEVEDGYRIYSDDPEGITPGIITSLSNIGYETNRVGIEKPSLEDVFFELTKKSVREEAHG
jgi:ABC-type multidrug transport system ATPase subunit